MDIPFNMKAERIASVCNYCYGSGWRHSSTCPKCKGHGKIVVATRYVCDVNEPFQKAKD